MSRVSRSKKQTTKRMKLLIQSEKYSKFRKTIKTVEKSDYFDLTDEKGERVTDAITTHQQEALDSYGQFLALVPETDYPQVAFDVLQVFYHFNLTHLEEEYRFASVKIKPQEKRAIERDIAIAEKYRTTLRRGSKPLQKTITKYIDELKAYLEHRAQEIPLRDPKRQYKTYVTEHHEYTQIDEQDYEQYRQHDKYTKDDIEAVLKGIADRYNLKGYSKQIKAIKDKA